MSLTGQENIMSKHNNQALAVALNGALITELATSIARSSDENASSHDSLWLEVKSLFEKEPKAKDDKESRITAAKVWGLVSEYIVEGNHIARKRYYGAKPKKYASQTLKVDDNGKFLAVPSDKGLSFSIEGGYANYQLGKAYKLSFAECYEMPNPVYSALPFNKEDGTDKHKFGGVGESLQGYMKANRVTQQQYMTGKKSNIIKGWNIRFKKLCGVAAPIADPSLWEADLKGDCVDALDFFVKAKSNGKHMTEKKKEAWDTWFRSCPVSLKSSS
tara:strand:- start:18 stop:839 length:822 start_codon:yes stop_codon:yes gene_type:complete